MTQCHERVVKQHALARVPHHLLDILPPVWLEAMHRALGAKALLIPESAGLNALFRIKEQATALAAKILSRFPAVLLAMTVDLDHASDYFLFHLTSCSCHDCFVSFGSLLFLASPADLIRPVASR